jgi:hypothetical protein
MANSNFAFGLKWLGDLSAGDQNGAVRAYVIPSTDSSDYFLGDAVKSTGTGKTINGVTYATVTAAAAGDTLRGVIIGFAINPLNLNIIYGAASTDRIAYVVDSPFAVFEIQSNGTGAITDLGANANIVTGSGSVYTGLSGTQLNEASVATTNTLQLRILDPYPSVDNSIGQYVKYKVMINLHELKSITGN